MPYSIEQRVFIVEEYVRTTSIMSVREKFLEKYPEGRVPAKSTIQDLIKKWRTTGNVSNMKRDKQLTVRTPEAVANVQTIIGRSPSKSTRRLSQQVGISRTSCRRILHGLKMHAYRVSVVQELKEVDLARRVRYCQWVLQEIAEGNVDPFLFISTDEAWFHLSGYVNSQNTRYWATHNPHVTHEKPLHDLKIGVWCAMSGRRIIGPIFFEETVNTDVYLRIYEEFVTQLNPEEVSYAYFQQDGATCHTSDRSLARIHSDFTKERTISKDLWPARSPDLSPCDFYLWGRLKGNVYHNNPRTLEELKQNIRQEIANIPVEELQTVFLNMIRRAEICIQVGGSHFEQRL